MKKTCDNCEGEGSVMMVAEITEEPVGRKICSKCNGTGKIEDKK